MAVIAALTAFRAATALLRQFVHQRRGLVNGALEATN
jgi:hypothetical protein